MQKCFRILVVFLVSMMVMQPVVSLAGSSARIIPTGKVALLQDGKEAGVFQSEMPLPQGKLLTCKGNCLVQSEGLQLVAHDKAVFSMAEAGNVSDLNLNNGDMEFAIGSKSKQLAFHTPDDVITVANAEQGSGPVRGFITVSENGTDVKILEGNVQVADKDGSKVLRAGETMSLARANNGDATKAAMAGAAGAAGAAAAGGSGAGAAALGAAGVVAAGVAAATIDSDSRGSIDLSPSGLDTKPK